MRRDGTEQSGTLPIESNVKKPDENIIQGRLVCPECFSRNNHVDYYRGEIACLNCGLVLQEAGVPTNPPAQSKQIDLYMEHEQWKRNYLKWWLSVKRSGVH